MRLLFGVLLCLLCSCGPVNKLISYDTNTKPAYEIVPPPQKVLLLNSYDIVSKKFRDNKEELFINFADSLMKVASEKIQARTGIRTEILGGFTNTRGNADSSIYALVRQHEASHAIVIDTLDIFFTQTNVERTRGSDGKISKEAFYDIESIIGYSFYKNDSLLKTMNVNSRQFHSSRGTSSGLFMIGPNVVVQRKYAWAIAKENLQKYLNNFFPGEVQRSRILFTTKEFQAVGAAVSRGDFEAAMTESLRLVDDPNRERVAKANYNCAVLFERKNQPAEVKTYLDRSLGAFDLPEARKMQADFER